MRTEQPFGSIELLVYANLKRITTRPIFESVELSEKASFIASTYMYNYFVQ